MSTPSFLEVEIHPCIIFVVRKKNTYFFNKTKRLIKLRLEGSESVKMCLSDLIQKEQNW